MTDATSSRAGAGSGDELVRPWPPEGGVDGVDAAEASDLLTDGEIDALDEVEVRALLRQVRDEQREDAVGAPRQGGAAWGLSALVAGVLALVTSLVADRVSYTAVVQGTVDPVTGALAGLSTGTMVLLTVVQAGFALVALALCALVVARAGRGRLTAGAGAGLAAWWLTTYGVTGLLYGFWY